MKLVALGVVFNLTVILKNEPLPSPAAGVSGVFFCTKTHKLANWVIRDGKVIYPFPYWDTKQRGCLVVWKDGKYELRMFSANEALQICRNPQNVKLAVGGAGYFLRRGRIALISEMQKEGIPKSVLKSRYFGFLAVNPKNQAILGNSYGHTLTKVAFILQEMGFTDAIRLDGGSAVSAWKSGKKFPPNTNNIIVIVNPIASP